MNFHLQMINLLKMRQLILIVSVPDHIMVTISYHKLP